MVYRHHVGYFLMRRPQCCSNLLTAIVPTSKYTSMTRSIIARLQWRWPAGTADVVNLTTGDVRANHRSTLTLGTSRL